MLARGKHSRGGGGRPKIGHICDMEMEEESGYSVTGNNTPQARWDSLVLWPFGI